MDAAALIARMEAQRSSWVELAEGRKVRIVRPPEVELAQLAAGIRVEHAVRYVTDWQGFTEAVLLGPAQGSADTDVPFDRGVWEAWASDHVDEATKVIGALADRCTEYLKRRKETAKNSKPSST